MRSSSLHARRAVMCLIAGLLLIPVPAGAGRVETRDGETVIHVTLWQLPDPSRSEPFWRAEVAGVRAFVRRFPEIFARKYAARYRADPETYGRFDWDHVRIQLAQSSGIVVEGVENDLLKIAGGMAEDVLYVNFRKSDNYIQNNFLYPLDKPEDGYIGDLDGARITDEGVVRAGAFTGGMSDDALNFRIHPRIWPVIRRKGPHGRTHVWAVPFGGALGKVLLYRKDLFDERGIAYPDEHWTWDDLHAACRQITDPARGTYGIQFARGKHESWHWVTYLWSAGGDVMTYDAVTDRWRCVFDSRAAAVALDFYTRLCTEPWTDAGGRLRRGYSSKDATDSGVKWERGEIGMCLSYIDEKLFSTINPDVTGMAPVPLGPSGLRGAELNSRMMGLFSDIKDPVVRDAAWEYIRFYDSEEAVRIKTRVLVEGGLGRFVNPRYLRAFGYPEVERLSPPGWAETFAIAIATGRPEPYGRNSNFAYDMMTFPIQEVENMAVAGALPEETEARLDVIQDVLRAWNAKANEEMIGIVPPRERLLRRILAAVVLAAIVFVFAFVFRRIIRTFTPEHVLQAGGPVWGFRRYKWAYLLLVPAVLTIFVWQYVPLARGSLMAFQDYRILGDSTWVWLDNFGDLLWDGRWWLSVRQSLYYSFLVISLTFLPPVVLAILLQEVPRATLLFRTIYYLPAVITGLVTILLWKQFYDPSEFGVLNAILIRVPAGLYVVVGVGLLLLSLAFARRLWFHDSRLPGGIAAMAGLLLLGTCLWLAAPILVPAAGPSLAELGPLEGARELLRRLLVHRLPEPYNWLSDSRTAMIACVLPMVWAGMGPGCLIYLAALKGIADDFYEAADIDGATFIDKILFVVFPILKPLLIINFVGVFIGSWYGATANILAMTGGGAGTEVAGLHIWYKAFTYLKFGPATAMAWMLGSMLIGFTVYQLRILSRLEFRTTGGRK